jgi:hypothetical protein
VGLAPYTLSLLVVVGDYYGWCNYLVLLELPWC